MKEKDNAKCKEWERRRRGKINDAFKILSQLLPNHDPAKNLPKIDILERSTEFVKELRLSNSRLLSEKAETDEKCKLIKELQDEVNKLILRVKQLTVLLKQAKIAIPIGPSIKSLGKRKLKWSEKLKPDNLENKSKAKDSNALKAHENASTPEVNGNPVVPVVPTVPLKESINTGTNNDKIQTPTTQALTSTANTIPLTSSLLNSTPGTDTTKTTSIHLPMQTIILTPVVNQSPQMITRIQLGPTRILPKPGDGISSILQKIPILPIRKKLPPKEKKRRNRKKKVVVSVTKVSTETANVMVQTNTNKPDDNELVKKDKDKSKSDGDKNTLKLNEVESSVSLPVVESNPKVPKVRSSNNEDSINCSELLKDKNSLTDNIVEKEMVTDHVAGAQAKISETISTENEKAESSNIPDIPSGKESLQNSTASNLNSKAGIEKLLNDLQEPPPVQTAIESTEHANEIAMEVQIGAQEVEILMTKGEKAEKDNMAKAPGATNSMIQERIIITDAQQFMPTAVPEAMEIDTDSIAENSKMPTKSSNTLENNLQEKVEKVLNNPQSTPVTTTENTIAIEKSRSITTISHLTSNNETNAQKSSQVPHVQLSNTSQLKAVKVSSVGKSIESTNMDLEPISTPNPVTSSSLNDSVTGDKISECIARSIDLIDAPEGELMELADNWGDNAESSKSPISPTQMFLSMFPLLPREGIVSVSEGSQQGPLPSSGKSTYNFSSSHRSSFFINAMLPEDNVTTSNHPGITNNQSQNNAESFPSNNTHNAQVKTSNQIIPVSTSQTPSATISRPGDLPVFTMEVPSTASSSRTVPISSQHYQTQKSKQSESISKTTTTTTPSRKPTETVPPVTNVKTNSNTRDLLFPDPLDFGNFTHIPLGQIQHIEDLFSRDTTKVRNPSECQQAPTSVCQSLPVNPNANVISTNHPQIDFFGNQFPSQPHQHGHVQFPRFPNVHPPHQFPPIPNTSNLSLQPVNPVTQPLPNIFNPSSLPTPSSTLYNLDNRNFLHQPQNSNQTNKSSRTSTNLITQQPTGHKPGTYNAFDFRHQPVVEMPPTTPNTNTNQKQPSNVKQNQLFRPHLGDCRQTEFPSPQQISSTSKTANISTAQKSSNIQPGYQDVSKCVQPQKIAPSTQQRQQGQNSQNISQQIVQPSRDLYPSEHIAIIPQIQSQSQRNQVQNQYQRITNPVEKQPVSKSFQSNKPSASEQSSSKKSQKSQSKDASTSQSSNSSKKATSLYQSVSKRPHETTSSQEFTNPLPQNQGQMVQNIRRSEQMSSISNQVTPQPISSFPDFSLSMNFNQPYEPVAPHQYISHNYSTPSVNPYQPHQQQVVAPQQKKNSRPTPFYLQDVPSHCETFNFSAPVHTTPHSIPNQQHTQHVSNTNQPSYGNIPTIPSSNNTNQKSHYHVTPNPTPRIASSARTSLSSTNAVTNISNPNASQTQYFVNPSNHHQSTSSACQQQQQGNYPHQSPSSTTTSSSRSHQLHQQHGNAIVSENPVIYNSHNPNPNNLNPHQQQAIPQAKSKPATSIPQQQHNQPNYANQACLARNQSSVGANNSSNSNSLSLPSSSATPTSRPVNWMTDTPYRTSNKSNSTPSTGTTSLTSTTTTIATNPFSVSKLVGNTSSGNSGPSNVNQTNANSTNTKTSNSFNPNNPNTNYCAEALIRKNPPNPNNTSWNNLNFGPSVADSASSTTNLNHHPQHPQSQTQHLHQQPVVASSSTSQPQCFPQYQASNSQHDNFNFSGYATTNFSHYNNYHQSQTNPSDHSNSVNNVFGHFDPNMNQQNLQQQSHQQYHHHFPQSHNSSIGQNNSNSSNHQNPNLLSHPHHHQQSQHGTTSSVSNFNLSSIFPEINDKRNSTNNTASNASNNNISGSNASAASSNCGYYSGHGSSVSKH